MTEWQLLAKRLRQRHSQFVIEPGFRFVGETGEQATLFIADPSGNVLEFKAFRDPENLFAS
jgi:extradiol dioxygenase family protein